MNSRFYLKTLSLVLIGVLTGCAIGPDYQRPTTAQAVDFKQVEGWKLATPADTTLPESWWTLYNDAELNQLQQKLLLSNQNLAQYEARYRQAIALVKGARAAYFPTVSANVNSTRAQQGRANTVTDRYDLGPSASWELDIWGKIRRQVESAKADAQGSQADLAAAKLSLQSELAQTYFQLRIMDIHQQLLDHTVEAYRRSLTLTENQYNAGMVVKSDMTQARTQLKNTEAQAIDIKYQRAQLEHAIAVLIGEAPANFSIKPTYQVPALPVIPKVLPSQLLERRPDIASAEQQVISANAQIGVAKAAWFPDLTLSASAGYASNSFSHWINSPNRYWSLGPQFAMTLFDGGLIRSRYEQAEAAYDEKVANYRQTVLNSFREVEDYLVQLYIMEQESVVQKEATDSAKESLQLITNQYEAGMIDYLNVASAQYSALNTERTGITLLGNQLTASVQLIAAIGGGWTTKDLTKE
ncbi:efflux transporter outer membrane subunit [Entomomonas asaccharolytica]|uniref:Efflux transporter outer membrane subunit n=1 Tax=Entomomonas asaccharolytica TaxID=2785331 RepID=A0A974NHY9_9GAMM|nr:efflux transporter outer membrane subunit [Entomomonas asaccharolytica]QQP86983.1 efflux transporter outer membrane subunit [Entomomonas asaccharolytica]